MVEDSDITTLQLVYRPIDKEISFSVLLDLEKEMDFNMKVASGAGGPLFSSPKIKLLDFIQKLIFAATFHKKISDDIENGSNNEQKLQRWKWMERWLCRGYDHAITNTSLTMDDGWSQDIK